MDFGGLVLFAAVGGFILGFLIGAALSALCVIKISGVVESPPPAEDDISGDSDAEAEKKGFSGRAKALIAVGVGCGGLALLAVVGAVLLVTLMAPTLDEMGIDGDFTIEDFAQFYVPPDERVFPASAGKELILELGGDLLEGEVASTRAVLAGGPGSRALVISAELATAEAAAMPVAISIDQPLWEHIEIGRPMLLNDPRPTASLDHLEIRLGAEPQSIEYSSSLGEDFLYRSELVGGRVTFSSFGSEPGSRVAGVAEASLLPSAEAAIDAPGARLLLRFDTVVAEDAEGVATAAPEAPAVSEPRPTG
jgi:hypothetical protein